MNESGNGIGKEKIRNHAQAHPSAKVDLIPTRHRRIMYMLLAGVSIPDIAKDMRMSPSAIRSIKSSPLFVTELNRLELALEEKVKDNLAAFRRKVYTLQTKALSVHEQIIQNEEAPLALKRQAANDVLRLGIEQHRQDQDLEKGKSDEDPFTRRLREAVKINTKRRKRANVTVESKDPPFLDIEAEAIA